jgi:DNA-binding MarR family transcriptional regulator
MRDPTPAEARTLRFIYEHRMKTGFSPTITEVARAFTVKPPAIHNTVERLVRKGYLARTSISLSSDMRRLPAVGLTRSGTLWISRLAIPPSNPI